MSDKKLMHRIMMLKNKLIIYDHLQEHENRILPWLWSFGVFIGFRFVAFLFFAIVNDLYFFYNIFMTILWIMMISASIYGWLTVYSVFIELADLTKLEDLAHLRVS